MITVKLAGVIKNYEEYIGMVTPIVLEELTEIVSAYPSGWFEEATQRACAQGKRRLAYIKAILESWHRSGKDEYKVKPDTSGITVIEG